MNYRNDDSAQLIGLLGVLTLFGLFGIAGVVVG